MRPPRAKPWVHETVVSALAQHAASRARHSCESGGQFSGHPAGIFDRSISRRDRTTRSPPGSLGSGSTCSPPHHTHRTRPRSRVKDIRPPQADQSEEALHQRRGRHWCQLGQNMAAAGMDRHAMALAYLRGRRRRVDAVAAAMPAAVPATAAAAAAATAEVAGLVAVVAVASAVADRVCSLAACRRTLDGRRMHPLAD